MEPNVLSAPPAIVRVRKTDVNTDISTDWSENAVPRNLSEIFEQAMLGERSSVRPEAADVWFVGV